MKAMLAGVLVVAATLALAGCGGPEQRPEGGHDHGAHGYSHDAKVPHDHHATAPALTKDPICGMEVSQPAALFVDEGGQRFPFCAEACRTRFLADPHPLGQAAFDKSCTCRTEMPNCDCGHCTGAFEPCPCGS